MKRVDCRGRFRSNREDTELYDQVLDAWRNFYALKERLRQKGYNYDYAGAFVLALLLYLVLRMAKKEQSMVGVNRRQLLILEACPC